MKDFPNLTVDGNDPENSKETNDKNLSFMDSSFMKYLIFSTLSYFSLFPRRPSECNEQHAEKKDVIAGGGKDPSSHETQV